MRILEKIAEVIILFVVLFLVTYSVIWSITTNEISCGYDYMYDNNCDF